MADERQQVRRSIAELARGRRSPVTMSSAEHRARVIALSRGDRMLFGGAQAEDEDHAVCCAILVDGKTDGSGVALDPHTVLTAAHVVATKDARDPQRWMPVAHERLQVYAGRSAAVDNDAAIAVTQPVQIHECYDPRSAYSRSACSIAGTTPKYDAALLRVASRLDRHVPNVAPVSPASIVEVLGFGSTRAEHRSRQDTGIRHFAQFGIAADQDDTRRNDLGYCPPAEFLLGERDAAKISPDTRSGDSGGPVVDVTTRSLVGITCRGALAYDGQLRYCGVYLAVEAILDWIITSGVAVAGRRAS